MLRLPAILCFVVFSICLQIVLPHPCDNELQHRKSCDDDIDYFRCHLKEFTSGSMSCPKFVDGGLCLSFPTEMSSFCCFTFEEQCAPSGAIIPGKSSGEPSLPAEEKQLQRSTLCSFADSALRVIAPLLTAAAKIPSRAASTSILSRPVYSGKRDVARPLPSETSAGGDWSVRLGHEMKDYVGRTELAGLSSNGTPFEDESFREMGLIEEEEQEEPPARGATSPMSSTNNITGMQESASSVPSDTNREAAAVQIGGAATAVRTPFFGGDTASPQVAVGALSASLDTSEIDEVRLAPEEADIDVNSNFTTQLSTSTPRRARRGIRTTRAASRGLQQKVEDERGKPLVSPQMKQLLAEFTFDKLRDDPEHYTSLAKPFFGSRLPHDFTPLRLQVLSLARDLLDSLKDPIRCPHCLSLLISDVFIDSLPGESFSLQMPYEMHESTSNETAATYTPVAEPPSATKSLLLKRAEGPPRKVDGKYKLTKTTEELEEAIPLFIEAFLNSYVSAVRREERKGELLTLEAFLTELAEAVLAAGQVEDLGGFLSNPNLFALQALERLEDMHPMQRLDVAMEAVPLYTTTFHCGEIADIMALVMSGPQGGDDGAGEQQADDDLGAGDGVGQHTSRFSSSRLGDVMVDAPVLPEAVDKLHDEAGRLEVHPSGPLIANPEAQMLLRRHLYPNGSSLNYNNFSESEINFVEVTSTQIGRLAVGSTPPAGGEVLKRVNFVPDLLSTMPTMTEEETLLGQPCVDVPEAFLDSLLRAHVYLDCSELIAKVGCEISRFVVPVEIVVKACKKTWWSACALKLSGTLEEFDAPLNTEIMSLLAESRCAPPGSFEETLEGVRNVEDKEDFDAITTRPLTRETTGAARDIKIGDWLSIFVVLLSPQVRDSF